MTNPLGVPALSGYATSAGVWWTDPGRSEVGLARVPLAPAADTSGGFGTGGGGRAPGRKSRGGGRPLITLFKRIGHHGWGVSFAVRCGRPTACRGRAQLRTIKAPGIRARTLLGSTPFKVAGDHKKTMRVTVDRRGRRLLAGLGGRVTALLVLQPRQGPSLVRRVRLRPPGG